MRSERHLGAFAFVVLLAVAACEPARENRAGGAAQGPADSPSDGLAAALSDNPMAAPSGAPGVGGVPTWTTCGVPHLEVGRRDPGLFGVGGAALTARDELVVVNQGTGELHFFDREGERVRTTGGRGAGPGEFTEVQLVPDWSSDSLLVFDEPQQRLSVMDPEGRFVRLVRLRREDGTPLERRVQVQGRLRDGRLLVRGFGVRPSDTLGLVRARASVALHRSDGRLDSMLGEFEGDEVLFAEYQGLRITSRLPFLGTFLLAAGADQAFLFEGPDLEIVSVAPDLFVPYRFSREVRARTMTAEQYSMWVDSQIGALDPTATIDETRKYYEEIFEPWTLQVVDRIFVDQEGQLWVGSERFQNEPEWIVLDEQLRGLAVVELPAGFRPLHATRTEVVGVRRDSLGRETVEVRCLTRSED